MEIITLLAHFTDVEDLKDFAAEEPFSRAHVTIEKADKLNLYVRVKTDRKHLAPLMAVILAYGGVPHVLKVEELH